MHVTPRSDHLLRFSGRILALLLLALALYGCAVTGPAPPHPARPQPAQVTKPSEMTKPTEVTKPAEPLAAPATRPTGPAASLYQQADSALRAGDPARAEILIERALRIDPDQALYWHTLGRAKYDQGAYAQAVQFFLKAESRMQERGPLAHSNRQFLEAARSKAP